MSPTDFRVYEVNHLCSTNLVDGKGYLCICKTRCGNAAFFKWFNETVLLPFVEKLKVQYGNDKNACVCCDGEKLQTDPYFNPEILDRLSGLKTLVGKFAASSTAVSQMLDAWKVFCTLKHYLKMVTDAEVNEHVALHGAIKAALQRHEGDVGHSLTDSYKNRISMGLMKIRRVIELHYRSNLIVESFKQVGLSMIGGKIELVVNKVLTQYSQSLTTAEVINLKSNLSDASNLFMRNGTITDNEMRRLFTCVVQDEAHRGGRHVHRDRMCLTSQRCVIMTNKKTIREWQRRWQAIQDAPRIAAEKKLARAEKKRKREAEMEMVQERKRLKQEARLQKKADA
jgi:hypothetical protein